MGKRHKLTCFGSTVELLKETQSTVLPTNSQGFGGKQNKDTEG